MSAIESACGAYRYLLLREDPQLVTDKGSLVICMLNPSTADGTVDDPTIRRCRGYAEAWGSAGLTVVNLYALRATKPAALWKHDDPVGLENDYWLQRIARNAGTVVCAWGANAKAARVAKVVDIFTAAGAELVCLGKTKDGAPRHPLYVPAIQQLEPWAP